MDRENLTGREVRVLYGIGEGTAYEWRQAYRRWGEAGLVSQPPGTSAERGAPPAAVRQAIVEAKREHPESGTRR